jgi:hypothetical protein
MIRRCYFLMLAAFFAVAALWASAQPPADNAKLRENLKAYLALPKDRQNAIKKLQHDLEGAKDKRLWTALERYADWLEHLRQQDPQAYQAIKDAPNSASRLTLIKEQRDREWMAQQPKVQREKWDVLKGDARTEFVAKLHKEARQKHAQWVIAQRFWKELESKQVMPTRMSDFALENKKKDKDAPKMVNKVETYFNAYVKPYMTAQEEEQLREAEGRWPDYPLALVEIASRRTPALPPAKALGKFNDLPAPIRLKLTDAKAAKDIKKAVQRYHQLDGSAAFASRLVEMAGKDGKLPFEHEYLASNPASLLRPMKKFWEDELVPAVKKDAADLKKLTSSEGKWPDFPLAIQELSRKHNLQPPWYLLPEPDHWKWEQYRDVKARSWGFEVAKDKKKP